MWYFASRLNEMFKLRSDDFEDKDCQKSAYYYAIKKNPRNKIYYFNIDLYDRVMEFKEFKIDK